MKPLLQRVLMAYRPLYLHGLLMDGRHQPLATTPNDPTMTTRSRRRMLLVALVGMRHHLFHTRSKR